MGHLRLAFSASIITIFLATTLWGQTPLASPSPSAALAENTAPSVRVAFWNIKWFPGGRPNAYKSEETKQIRSVHAEIPKLKAEVIGLEEVRDWESAALAIKPLKGFKVDVCSTFPPREGETDTQQVAIASSLEPMSAWVERWQTGGVITPPRGFAFATYEIAPRQILLVYALHLKSNYGEVVEDIAIREESMRQLLRHMKDMEAAYSKLGTLAWVVGGDFNTAPDDKRLRRDKTSSMLMQTGFTWSWQGLPFPNRITMPRGKQFPAECFDHIFLRGAAFKNAEVLATADASSDHRAVRAEIAFDSTR